MITTIDANVGLIDQILMILKNNTKGEMVIRLEDEHGFLATKYIPCVGCPYEKVDSGICPTTKEGDKFCWVNTTDVILDNQLREIILIKVV